MRPYSLFAGGLFRLAACLVAGVAVSSAALAQSNPAVTINPSQLGTSFDCSRNAPGIPSLVCSDPELRVADLKQMQAYYALRHAAPNRHEELRTQFVSRVQGLVRDCSAENIRAADTQKQCTSRGFNDIRNFWISQLREIGNIGALEEAQLDPERLTAVQATLRHLGYMATNSAPDGVYGSATRDALARLQTERTLPRNGFANNITVQSLLENRTSTAVSSPASNNAPSQSPSVARPQENSSSVQNTLERLRNAQQAERRPTLERGPAPNNSTSPTPMERSPPLTQGEIRGLADQVDECWHMEAGMLGLQPVTVELRVQLDSQGNVRNVVPAGQLPTDPRAIAVYETALRALLSPKCNPLKVPQDKVQTVMASTFRFNPRGLVHQNITEEERQVLERQRAERDATAQRETQARQAQSEQNRRTPRVELSAVVQAYRGRNKTLLEEILNYTTTGKEEGIFEVGLENLLGGAPLTSNFWISGYLGDHKCILKNLIRTFDWETGQTTWSISQSIDIREFNERRFRISGIPPFVTVGDERSRISSTAWLALDRLQRAWDLAFKECPGRRAAF